MRSFELLLKRNTTQLLHFALGAYWSSSNILFHFFNSDRFFHYFDRINLHLNPPIRRTLTKPVFISRAECATWLSLSRHGFPHSRYANNCTQPTCPSVNLKTCGSLPLRYILICLLVSVRLEISCSSYTFCQILTFVVCVCALVCVYSIHLNISTFLFRIVCMCEGSLAWIYLIFLIRIMNHNVY